MTNRKAIEILREKISLCVTGEWKESVDAAISALQAQDVPDTNVGDMVSRQAAIDALLKEVRLVDGYYVENDEVIDKDDAIEAIRLLPSVTPKRKTGKWIYPYETTTLVSICSECGAHGRGNFCSNCGADMRGEIDAVTGTVQAKEG